MTGSTVINRVRSLVVASPFALTESPEPFSFDRAPQQTVIDGVVRLELNSQAVRGGLAYSEERIDVLTCWVASPHNGDPGTTYRSLQTLANSLTSAIVRDGCGDGDFGVTDGGRGLDIRQDATASYQVLRLSLPVTYVLTI